MVKRRTSLAVQVNLRIRAETKDRLKESAGADLRSISDQADVLINEALDARDKLHKQK